MVDMPANVSFTQFVAWKIGKLLDSRARKRAYSAFNWVQFTVRLILHIGGFSALTIGGFSISITAGWVVAGFSCFALSWLTTERTTTETETSPQLR